jgi:murein L,D-transpeptidase YcbB/YkuD
MSPQFTGGFFIFYISIVKKVTILLSWILPILFCGCGPNGATIKNKVSNTFSDTIRPQVVAGNFSDQKNLKVDSLEIVSFTTLFSLFLPYQKELHRFYKSRDYNMAWHDANGRIENVQILYNRIMQMEENGLPVDVPYIEEYKRWIGKQGADSLIEFELMQTAQYLHFANRVLGGVSEKESKMMLWYIPRKKTDYLHLLDEFVTGDAAAMDRSIYPQYHLLKSALVGLMEIQKNGGWGIVDPIKRKIKKGDSQTIVISIKERLFTSGELKENDASPLYNQPLEDAVLLFQTKHGLKADGVIGLNTLRQMNISTEDRIKQIIVNLERCRWLPNETDGDYLVVNIPAYNLSVMHGDSLIFSCGAIVGKETNRTAIFKGQLSHVVFNPYWNVPAKILQKEILPMLAKNKNYLAENNMEWYDGRLRQKPGPDNALGEIKFLFPNPFDIYLHDTPAKGLFQEERRAFSHGCIRIAEPERLALYLLRDKKGWSSEEMERILDLKKERYIKLDNQVPVYVLYLTAFVDFNGNINFREDIYNRDQSLLGMLLKN